MPLFHVDTGTRRVSVEGASQAIKEATRDVYLSPHHERDHLNRLQASGRTAWSYAFASVMIELDRGEHVTIDQSASATTIVVPGAASAEGDGADEVTHREGTDQ